MRQLSKILVTWRYLVYYFKLFAWNKDFFVPVHVCIVAIVVRVLNLSNLCFVYLLSNFLQYATLWFIFYCVLFVNICI